MEKYIAYTSDVEPEPSGPYVDERQNSVHVYLVSDVDARIAELERLLDAEQRARVAASAGDYVALMFKADAERFKNRVDELEKALREIAAFEVGDLRGLEDEIAIYRIATRALMAG